MHQKITILKTVKNINIKKYHLLVKNIFMYKFYKKKIMKNVHQYIKTHFSLKARKYTVVHYT